MPRLLRNALLGAVALASGAACGPSQPETEGIVLTQPARFYEKESPPKIEQYIRVVEGGQSLNGFETKDFSVKVGGGAISDFHVQPQPAKTGGLYLTVILDAAPTASDLPPRTTAASPKKFPTLPKDPNRDPTWARMKELAGYFLQDGNYFGQVELVRANSYGVVSPMGTRRGGLDEVDVTPPTKVGKAFEIPLDEKLGAIKKVLDVARPKLGPDVRQAVLVISRNPMGAEAKGKVEKDIPVFAINLASRDDAYLSSLCAASGGEYAKAKPGNEEALYQEYRQKIMSATAAGYGISFRQPGATEIPIFDITARKNGKTYTRSVVPPVPLARWLAIIAALVFVTVLVVVVYRLVAIRLRGPAVAQQVAKTPTAFDGDTLSTAADAAGRRSSGLDIAGKTASSAEIGGRRSGSIPMSGAAVRTEFDPDYVVASAKYSVTMTPLDNSAQAFTVGRTVVIGRGGRAGDNGRVVISNSSVSSDQAELLVPTGQGEVFIKNLSSRKSTLVNGQVVEEQTPLKSGDLVQMGYLKYVVDIVQNDPSSVQAP